MVVKFTFQSVFGNSRRNPRPSSARGREETFFGGREATTGNASSVRRLAWGYAHGFQHVFSSNGWHLESSIILVYGRV